MAVGGVDVETIAVGPFARRLRRLADDHADFRIVWFLGAGCSVTSGIPTAAGLVRLWLPMLMKERTGSSDGWEAWATKEYPAFVDDPASLYGEAISTLFRSERERQRTMEVLTAEKDPEIGYAVLAMLMAHPRFGRQANVVLSTNFDDLVQDALYLLTRKKPLVVAHDSLAAFARHSMERPLIVKVHGDAHLASRNTRDETAALEPAMNDALADLLRGSCLLFCGYGGNDESIAALVSRLPAKTLEWGIYWIGDRLSSGPVGAALARRDETLLHVTHGDFDQLMLEIANEFELNLPPFDRFKKLEELYARSLRRGAQRASASDGAATGPSAGSAAAASRMSETIDAQRLVEEALALKDDPDRADALFQRAVAAAPTTSWVLVNYAVFLTTVRQDPERAEAYYRRAIDANPTQANILGSYALFLQAVRQDREGADEYYRRAIDADPTRASILGSYALFLQTVRQDSKRAEEYYRRAIDADPTHAWILANYAWFLQTVRQDPERAEEYYGRAIDADPTHASILGNYAWFLHTVRKDPQRAEEYYRRAIDADPTRARILANYAWFLQTVRQDPERAEEYYRRAIDADPTRADILGGYALFLQNVRHDPEQAEEHYRRAIDADPPHANALGNYAQLLFALRRDAEAGTSSGGPSRVIRNLHSLSSWRSTGLPMCPRSGTERSGTSNDSSWKGHGRPGGTSAMTSPGQPRWGTRSPTCWSTSPM